MPKRTREHELETESRTVLKSVTPSRWLLRDKTEDYGIDGEVELFSPKKQTTGLMFLFQIKGTDESQLRKALAVPVRVETFEYYQSLDLPVLLIRYIAKTKKLYGKWINSFDLHGLKAQKTYTLRLSESDELTAEAFEKIERTLLALRKLKTGRVSLPLQFSVSLDGDKVFNKSLSDLIISLNNAAKSKNIKCKFSTAKDADFQLRLNSKEFRASYADVRGLVVHIDEDYMELSERCLVPDIFCTIAYFLINLKIQNGAVILQDFLLMSSLISTQNGLAFAVEQLARFKLTNLFLVLVDFLLNKRHSPEAAYFAYQFAIVAQENESSFFNDIEPSALQFAKTMLQEGHTNKAATISYNIGNIQISTGRYREAIRSYVFAAKANPTYKERDYFWSEIAGTFFLLRKYSVSARCYQKTYEIKKTTSIVSLYADALMFSGQYDRALKEFHDCTYNRINLSSAEFVLKPLLLHYLVDELKLKIQKRNHTEATKICNQALKELKESDILQGLRQSILRDGLCNFAWYNMAILYVKQGDRELAALYFLFAAVSERSDAQAWAHALFLLPQGESTAFRFALIFQSGYFACADQFLIEIQTLAAQQGDDFNKEEFMLGVIKATELFSEAVGEKIIRFISDGGNYKTILKPRGSDD